MLTRRLGEYVIPAVAPVPAVPAQPAVPEQKVCGQQKTVVTERECGVIAVMVFHNSDVGWTRALPPNTTHFTVTQAPGGYLIVQVFGCVTNTRTTYGPWTCTTTPGTPAVPSSPAIPGRPEQRISYVDSSWEGGALSVKSLDGDVQLRYTQARVTGAVTGFIPYDEEAPQPYADPLLVTHGWYFFTSTDGIDQMQIMEQGRKIGAPVARDVDDEFAIVRHDGVVTYQVNEEPFYTSQLSSAGPLRISTNLFSSGDQISSGGTDPEPEGGE